MQVNRAISVSALVLTMLFCANAFSQSLTRHTGFIASGVASGAQEVPSNASQAKAVVYVLFDEGLTQAQVLLKLDGVNSVVVASHFHCALPGQNGPVSFGLLSPGPLGGIVGEASTTLTNAHSVGVCTVAGHTVSNIAGLYFAMKEGLIYLNVHTAEYPGGEVRAQMQVER